MRYLILTLLLCSQLTVNSQDLLGEWSGTHGTYDNLHKLEITIVQKGNQITGTSKCINSRTGEYSVCELTGNIKGNRVVLYEESITQLNLYGSTAWCLEEHRGELVIDKVNKKMTIRGATKTHKYYDVSSQTLMMKSCPPGEFTLTKPLKPDPPTQDTPRPIKISQTVNVVSDSLTLLFYDDSEIDGDTITVYYNKNIILTRRLLKGKDSAISIKIPIIPGTDNELVMFADNLGTIPPNTALLIFNDNGIERKIRIESNIQTSGGILIRKNL